MGFLLVHQEGKWVSMDSMDNENGKLMHIKVKFIQSKWINITI